VAISQIFQELSKLNSEKKQAQASHQMTHICFWCFITL